MQGKFLLCIFQVALFQLAVSCRLYCLVLAQSEAGEAEHEGEQQA